MQCDVCDTVDQFDLTDGVGFCRICGTQSQQMREVVAEFDETVVGYEVARGANKTVIAVPDTLWTKEEALQHVLQQQVAALVQYGYPSSIKTSVGNLWFRFLAVTGRVKIAGIAVTDAKYVISPVDNLVLLYLAMRQINIPIFLADTIEWISHGVVPFINASSLLPPHYKPKKLFTNMNPKVIPDFTALNKRLTNVIELLCLPALVAANVGVLCDRLSEALFLPDRVGQLAAEVYTTTGREVQGGGCDDVRLLGCVITAIRLHYQFENTVFDKREWKAWLKQYLASVEGKLLKDVTTDSSLVQGQGKRQVDYPRLYWGPHAAYFLHMQVSEYLACIDNILNDISSVKQRGSEVVNQLCEQFSTYSLQAAPDVKQAVKEAITALQSVDQSAGLSSCRMLVVYPALEAAPPELRMLIAGLAARHKVLEEVLFTALQEIAASVERQITSF